MVIGSLMSCRKDAHEPQVIKDQNIQAGVENGHLVFKTTDDYNKVLDSEDPGHLIKRLKGGETFISLMDQYKKRIKSSAKMIGNCNVPDSLIKDNESFFSVLDQDGVVQIENTLYRYDYCADRVWVISATNATNNSFYSDFMNGIERTGVVGYFPSYVDALEAVVTGYTTMPDENSVQGNEIFERTGLLGEQVLEHFDVNNNEKNEKETNRLFGKLHYDKFAIYFHFFGKEQYEALGQLSFFPDWRVNFKYDYQRKGSSSENTGTGILSPAGNNGNEVAKTFYEGSRGLKSGDATWDVYNVLAKYVFIERNAGSLWEQIIHYSLPTFQYVNNYPYINGAYRHFIISF